MMKIRSTRFLLLMLAVAVFAHTALASEQATVAEEESADVKSTTPKNSVLRSTHWMRNSAEYQALLRQTYTLATRLLGDMIESREPGTWAVALDADETVISNQPYDWELQIAGLESTSELWDAWVKRQEAPPLPGAIEFFEQVHEWGGHVVIVTNRSLEHCPDTEANFKKYSIPYDLMLCRGEELRKEPRWESIQQGKASPDLPPLEILLWMGDNIHDFPQMDQELRFKSGESFSLFGVKYLVTPNPIYGSWMENPAE